MRTVNGNIKTLLNTAYDNKDIEFTLCDKYGNQINTLDISGQIVTKQTVRTDSNGFFTVRLHETEQADIPMFYKMEFKDNESLNSIKLFIQQGIEDINFLKLLKPMPNLEMFYEIKNSKYEFKENVRETFNHYFVNENIFFNNDENNLIASFIEFADKNIDNKLLSNLDKHLASL